MNNINTHQIIIGLVIIITLIVIGLAINSTYDLGHSLKLSKKARYELIEITLSISLFVIISLNLIVIDKH